MIHLGLRFKRLSMLVGDYLVLHIALILTLVIRYGAFQYIDFQRHFLPFSLLGVLWICSFYVNGLYDTLFARDQFLQFRKYVEAMFVNLLLGLAFFYIIPFSIEPRTNLFLYVAIALLLGYAWRIFHARMIAPLFFRNAIMYIGHADDTRKLQEILKQNGQGYELKAVIETAPGSRIEDHSVFWYVDVSQIDRIIRERSIQTIVLGQKPDEVPGLRDALYKTLFMSVSVLDRATLEEAITGRVPLEFVSQTWFLENLREVEKAWYEGVKRVFDLFMAVPFGIFTILIFPFVAIAIRLSSPGPFLIRQTRIGKLGQPFTLYKFRSMNVLSADGSAETSGAQFTTDAKTDPRLFPVGRILRQLRIDELPQIWNVLRGDLSLIGPRPERPEFVTPLIERMPFYALRHLTRPGLTGWAQTRFLTPISSIDDNLKKLQYDLYYIRHRSFFLDITILLKTIGIVLRRQGT
ncbi:exopolysaccharide biosynthesis polyprenyl glycosylphosphotransferase [Candidatus Uhrbacteria bacterium]|nr:exopolysaccharide biosynthesis polyprenyl glycosylphosphotransferase [Candidatus Uhrbacteria bacterium]